MFCSKTLTWIAAGTLLATWTPAAAQTRGNPDEDIVGLLAEALEFYDSGAYPLASELLEKAKKQLDAAHTLRDRDMIERQILDYAFHVIQGEYGKAFEMLGIAEAPPAENMEEDLAELYERAADNGVRMAGMTVTRIEFTESEKAEARVQVRFVGLPPEEVTLLLSKPFLTAWAIEGYPAGGASPEHPTRILPLMSHEGVEGKPPQRRQTIQLN